MQSSGGSVPRDKRPLRTLTCQKLIPCLVLPGLRVAAGQRLLVAQHNGLLVTPTDVFRDVDSHGY